MRSPLRARLFINRCALRQLTTAVEAVLGYHTKQEIDEQPVLRDLRRAARHAAKVIITDAINNTPPHTP